MERPFLSVFDFLTNWVAKVQYAASDVQKVRYPPHIYKLTSTKPLLIKYVCNPPNSIPSIFCSMYLSDSVTCTCLILKHVQTPDQMARSLNWILSTWSRARDHWKGNISARNPEQFSTSQVSEKKKMYLDVMIIARDHWKTNNSTRTQQELNKNSCQEKRKIILMWG